MFAVAYIIILTGVRPTHTHTAMPCPKPQINQCTSTSSPLIIPTASTNRRKEVNGVLVEDDDSSTSSTVTVNNNNCLQHQQSSNNTQVLSVCLQSNDDEKSACSKKKTKKSIRFDEDRDISYKNTQMCREDCKLLWCSVQEFQRMKAATAGLARQVARYEEMDTSQHSYRRVMERTYEACCQTSIINMNNEPVNDDDDDDDGSTVDNILTAGGEQELEKWMECATTRLGLEKRAVRLIAQDRYARRKKITKTVLRLQDTCVSSSTTTTTPVTPEGKAELLRAASQAISRPSRLFAEVMARAQAASCRVKVEHRP
jgi:hypothetical protein